MSRTWILLRGLGRESGHWGDFPERLRESFSADRVLTLDLPGAGRFRDHAGPADMGAIFQFVRAQAIERAPVDTRFTLLTVSLGGMVAMEWMRARPSDLAGCVLINTSASALSPMYNRLRWQVWGDIAKILTITSPREREKAIIDLLMNREEARHAATPLWCRLASEHPVSLRTQFNQLFAAARFKGLTAPVNVPVLLLNGLGDRLVDPSCSSALHEKWGWPLERHPWAGHDLPWDDPEWTLEHLRAWAARATGAAAERGGTPPVV
jgi:pimeloyl-ACP methyl ester carboxylesterase